MTEIAEKSQGIAKKVATTLKGQTGIYATLSKEHGEVSSLLKQALKASSVAERASLVGKIRVELLSHSKAEESTLYAELARLDETRSIVAHSQKEHDEIERALDAVTRAPDQSAAESEALQRLRDTVEHHVEEEENEVFEKAHRALASDVERRLDADFKIIKEDEKQRLMESSTQPTTH